ncbi:MAG TPA: homoserine kinase [Thermaerobacter sp.]
MASGDAVGSMRPGLAGGPARRAGNLAEPAGREEPVKGPEPPVAVAWARVPATTANLGPGFDCLGMALSGLELRARLAPSSQDPAAWDRDEDDVLWELHGDGPATDPPGSNLVVRAIQAAFARAGQRHPAAWRLEVASTIPPARGLGSSAAAIVAGLAAANQWLRRCGRALRRSEMLHLAAELEGHADNVAAALLGGVAVAWREAAPPEAREGEAPGRAAEREAPAVGEGTGRWRALSFRPRLPLYAVLAIPERDALTREARAVLPEVIRRRDAVFNQSRVALLTLALSTGRTELLREAMRDRLHQPYRMRLFPWLEGLVARAEAAGAEGACLSGAGPSLLALARREEAGRVAEALRSGLLAEGVPGRVVICRVARHGYQSGMEGKWRGLQIRPRRARFLTGARGRGR